MTDIQYLMAGMVLFLGCAVLLQIFMCIYFAGRAAKEKDWKTVVMCVFGLLVIGTAIIKTVQC